MTSVSEVDWQMAPVEMRSWRRVRALVRLPLWATAKPPVSMSANSGCTLRSIGVAAGRVAIVADGDMALQALDDGGAGEVVADEAHAALGMELLAVEGDDAAGLLAAMLERVQARAR